MADHSPNFSCADPGVSHEFITEEAWRIVVDSPIHRPSITVIAITQLLFVLIGVPWNATVFTIILIKRLFKEPTYIFLLNMVFADLVVLTIMPFNVASAFLNEFPIGNSDFARCQVCHTIIIITLILTNVSIFALALLSVDRLIYIKWPFVYQKIITIKSVLLILVITWLICIVLILPPVFGFGEIKFANPVGSCSLITTGRNRVAWNIIYPMTLLVALSVPVVATFIANVWLLTTAYKGLKSRYNITRQSTISNINQNREDIQDLQEGYQKKQLHLVRVFGIIFAFNIVCWIPTSVITILSVIIGADNISIWWFAFVYLIYLCQPVIHPMLETCLVGKARKMVKVLCCCKKNDKRSVPVVKAFKRQLTSTTVLHK